MIDILNNWETITYFDSCRSTGKGDKSSSSLITNSWTWGVQKVIYTADKTGTLRWIGMTHLKGENK